MPPSPTSPTEQKEQLRHNLTNHAPLPHVADLLDHVTERMIGMGDFIIDAVPYGREQSMALTKLEELSQTVKAGIARNQDRIGPDRVH